MRLSFREVRISEKFAPFKSNAFQLKKLNHAILLWVRHKMRFSHYSTVTDLAKLRG